MASMHKDSLVLVRNDEEVEWSILYPAFDAMVTSILAISLPLERSFVSTVQYFTSSNTNQLELCIQHGSILLSYGKSVMESYALSMGKTCLRAVCKGDSMLVIYKMKDKSHKFRMKFDKSNEKSEEENCRECAEAMSKSFSVKVVPIKQVHETKPTDSASKTANSTVLQGDVTLSQIAEVIVGKSTGISLPECYRNISDFKDEDIGTCLKLCLTDPSFPAFVGKVEIELEKLKQEFSSQ